MTALRSAASAQLAVLLACIALASSAAPQNPSAGARAWSQARGNAAHSASVDVAPIDTRPVDRWRVHFDSLLAEPVTWGGTVYVVIRRGPKSLLCAIQADDGKVLEEQTLTLQGDVVLAVWNGIIAVQSGGTLRTWVHRNGLFRFGGQVDGDWSGTPAVADGLFFGSAGCADLERHKRLANVNRSWDNVALVSNASDQTLVAQIIYGPREGYEGMYLSMQVDDLRALRDGRAGPIPKRILWGGMLGESSDSSYSGGSLACPIDATGEHWLVFAEYGLRSTKGGSFHTCLLPAGSLAPIASPGVIHDRLIYGWNASGDMIVVLPDGKFGELVKKAQRPSGATKAPPSLAGKVLYLGNWAAELETGAVLWVREDLATKSALIPSGDGRAVLVTPQGELIGLADPDVADSTPDAQPVAARSAAPRPSAPGEGAGVILATGERVAGASVESAENGEIVMHAADGQERRFAAGEVAFWESSDVHKRCGALTPILEAWTTRLRFDHRRELARCFEADLRVRLLSDCQRLLRETEQLGAPLSEREPMQRRLSGLVENTDSNVEQQRSRLQREERTAREKTAKAYLAAAQWTRANDAGALAPLLLAEANRILPDYTPILELARETIPAAFPWKDAAAAKTWLAWSEELSPCDGEFVAADDPSWSATKAPPWKDRSILIRTPNILLISIDKDPATVGACLRSAEGAVRCLDQLMPDPAVAAAKAPRLEVRLLADRKEYLAEGSATGEAPPEWSAGYYRSDTGVSRFYVPRTAESAEPLGRPFTKTVVHELTHQVLDRRWAPLSERDREKTANQPGFWLVEGIAQLVEDQAVEAGRGGSRLDDRGVPSVEVCAQLAHDDKLLPMKDFVAWSHLDFARMKEASLGTVRVAHQLGLRQLSRRSLFYEQAGALVFFLVNQSEADARAHFFEVLRRHYELSDVDDLATELGFQGADDLDQRFRAFLAAGG